MSMRQLIVYQSVSVWFVKTIFIQSAAAETKREERVPFTGNFTPQRCLHTPIVALSVSPPPPTHPPTHTPPPLSSPPNVHTSAAAAAPPHTTAAQPSHCVKLAPPLPHCAAQSSSQSLAAAAANWAPWEGPSLLWLLLLWMKGVLLLLRDLLLLGLPCVAAALCWGGSWRECSGLPSLPPSLGDLQRKRWQGERAQWL